MTKLKDYADRILQETLIPIMRATQEDLSNFESDPTEYIRNLDNYTGALSSPRRQLRNLMCYLTMYSSEKREWNNFKWHKVKPDYLHGFFQFLVGQLDHCLVQAETSQLVDWRGKEALMYSLSTINLHVLRSDDLSSQMEAILLKYILPELASEQPFMRAAAC